MSNNFYTSPRKYAAIGYKPKYKTKRTAFEQGMGYALEALPAGMTRTEFKKIYSKWETILKNSGFDDIEYRSPSHTGHFTPFFKGKESGSTATFMRKYDSALEEYFRLCRHFDSEFDYRAAFGRKALMYKWLWYFHIEGVPYRAIAKTFSGEKTKWTMDLLKLPRHLKTSRSVFWAHTHVSYILNYFWEWAKANHGYDDPRLAR